ncbi:MULTISPECIES: hypothetical protein [Kitasatospora]|uniref:Uncharacterized protein n=1 Tax=Kitasatospora cathayae TaxID=3004092 RepID=A0ABY7PX99_9ACTN|nr:hypothetical protein [Kitasatospora sp. HUAS 3-15]WBP84787.1 hypothetical protein O1G21_02270 [Kitasatospora sp. HUAS 3-15]
MTLWPLDALAGLVTLALLVGAAFLHITGLKRWAGHRSRVSPGFVVVMAVAVPPALGAGFLWVGLPVSAWIHFAVGGIALLLIAVAPLVTAYRGRRPSRSWAGTDQGHGHRTLPPGTYVIGPSGRDSHPQVHHRGQVPTGWALGVLEPPEGPPYAQLIVEIVAEFHAELVEAAIDSGFVPSTDEPPETSGAVDVGDGLVVKRLLLDGGRCGWGPGWRVEARPDWLAAAEGRGSVLVSIVPPDTSPPGLPEMEPEAHRATFARGLAQARAEGRVLHGLAELQLGTAPGKRAGGRLARVRNGWRTRRQ